MYASLPQTFPPLHFATQVWSGLLLLLPPLRGQRVRQRACVAGGRSMPTTPPTTTTTTTAKTTTLFSHLSPNGVHLWTCDRRSKIEFAARERGASPSSNLIRFVNLASRLPTIDLLTLRPPTLDSDSSKRIGREEGTPLSGTDPQVGGKEA
jgi:hypothetical protein